MIDIALLDSIMPLMGWIAANLLIGGKEPVLMGNDNFTAAPSGTFTTADGYINIAANKQEQWHAVAEILEAPELKTDPRFAERDNRKKNRKALTPLLEEKLRMKPTAYWVEIFNRNSVPAGAILTLPEALDAAQVKFRNTLESVEKEGIGTLKLFNLTAKFSKTPGKLETPPPDLSQHNSEILGDLGYDTNAIKTLKDAGVI